MKLVLALVVVLSTVAAQPTNLYDAFQKSFQYTPSQLGGDVPADAYGNFTEYVERHGFTTETHEVITEDGYVLVLFRITGIQGGQSNIGKPVVLFQHGIIDSADVWVINSPDIAPGFQMARAGFDCWFGNNRGNKYSREHTYLSGKSQEYWEFSWQQMGEFDVPANVNYILANTGQEKLSYIGHSQGTSQMFAQLSDNPDFADKINIYCAFAPIASIYHQTIWAIDLAAYTPLAQILEFLGFYDILPYGNSPEFGYHFCNDLLPLCSFFQLFPDGNHTVDNIDRLPVIYAHEPGGTSTRDLMHYEQGITHGGEAFCKYDYGKLDNMRVYHNITAPCYDLGAIKAKVALFHGTDDKLADPRDVAWLKTQLREETLIYSELLQDFGHLTFTWGNADSMKYFDKVIELVKQQIDESETPTSQKFLTS